MRSFLQFVTTPTADTSGTTLLLHFDTKRYLFGSIAEGTQRASVEQRVRLLKVSELFLTGTTAWANTGGLIGMVLTLADAASSSAHASLEDTKKKITNKMQRDGTTADEDEVASQAASELKERSRLSVFGGPNLNYTLATARRFVFRKGMPVDVHELGNDFGGHDTKAPSSEPTWSDEMIKLWAVPITPTGSQRPVDRSASPRKRSFDELNDNQPSHTGPTLTKNDQEKALMMAKSVVSDMFDSSWRMDALVETPIKQVQLPATLFVRDPQSHKITKYTGPMPGGTEAVPNINVLVRRPWPGALVECLPPIQPSKVALSYIVRNHVQRGKFKPQAAMALGVEKGVKWANLSKGESVLNDKGETITPEQVLEANKIGNGAAIVDLPSVEYVEPFVSRAEWKTQSIMEGVGAFVWMLGAGVAAHPLLKQFMEERKDLKHVVSSPEFCSNRLAFDSAAAATTRLQQIDPSRYSVPVHDNSSAAQSIDQLEGLKDFAVVADRGQKIQLEPAISFSADEVSPLVDVEQVRSAMSKEVLESAAKAKQAVEEDRAQLNAWANSLPQKGAEIVTLGTGSALPSKYRNVSATLLRVPGWGSMLFDCGENTLGQLKRVFPPAEFQEVMRELRMVWISHMHADHHLGTVSVLREWYGIVHSAKPVPIVSPANDVDFDASTCVSNQSRLAVVSETAMLHWLEEYSHVEDFGYSRLAPLNITPNDTHKNISSNLSWFFPTSVTQTTNTLLAREAWSDKISRAKVTPQNLNLQDIQCVHVHHCHGARAVSVTFPSGFKASYSGDCRPSQAFTKIGQGSTVCIHEATFDDELQGDAEAKHHTTTSEALSVALGMGAKACVLTHFSQRYQKVPILEYTDDDDAINSLGTTVDDMDVSTDPEEEFDAPVADDTTTSASTAAPQNSNDNAANPTQPASNNAAKHIKIKAGSDMKVCVAFDYMRVKVDEIAEMEKYTNALVHHFAVEEAEDSQAGGPAAQAAAKAKKQAEQGKGGGKGKRNN